MATNDKCISFEKKMNPRAVDLSGKTATFFYLIPILHIIVTFFNLTVRSVRSLRDVGIYTELLTLKIIITLYLTSFCL